MKPIYEEKYTVKELIFYFRKMLKDSCDRETELNSSICDNIDVIADCDIGYEVEFHTFKQDDLWLRVWKEHSNLGKKIEYFRYCATPLSHRDNVFYKNNGYFIFDIENGKLSLTTQEYRGNFIKDIQVKDMEKLISDFKELKSLCTYKMPPLEHRYNETTGIYANGHSIRLYSGSNSITYNIAYDEISGRTREPNSSLNIISFLNAEVPASSIPKEYLDFITYCKIKGYDEAIPTVIAGLLSEDANIEKYRRFRFRRHDVSEVVDIDKKDN